MYEKGGESRDVLPARTFHIQRSPYLSSTQQQTRRRLPATLIFDPIFDLRQDFKLHIGWTDYAFVLAVETSLAK